MANPLPVVVSKHRREQTIRITAMEQLSVNLSRRFVQQITAIRLDMICIQKLDKCVFRRDRSPPTNELQLPGTESVLVATSAHAQVTSLIIARQ